MRDAVGRALDTSPRRAAEELRRTTELAAELARQRPQAPMTPLNEPISPNRRYAMRSADLATVKAAGKAAGGTVNDVILAVVAGHAARASSSGVDLDGRDPVALVPVSVRTRGRREASGNHISTVFVDLPVREPRPRRAHPHRQRRHDATLRESAAVRAGAMIVGAAGQAPPLVASMMVRAMGGVRAMNLVVSNVPGPQQTFYMNGAAAARGLPGRAAEPGQPGPQRRRHVLRRPGLLRPATPTRRSTRRSPRRPTRSTAALEDVRSSQLASKKAMKSGTRTHISSGTSRARPWATMTAT